jgi:DNA-binding transcriptional LysR family regulator
MQACCPHRCVLSAEAGSWRTRCTVFRYKMAVIGDCPRRHEPKVPTYAENGEVMDLLRALGTFNRIAETGSFSAVARETNSSQSAVTRLIGQLEAHFGVRLFHRTTRHLSLTEDGQDLLSHARRLLEVAVDMEGALGSHRSPTGLVRVGLSVGASNMLVPRMGALFERYPGLSVELVVGDRFHDLVEERLDVALQGGRPSDTSSVARVVGTFGRVPVAAPKYLERCGAPVHPTDLASHACIVHEAGLDSMIWHFSGPDGPIEVAVSGAFRANNSGVVHSATLAGYGIAFLPEQLVAHDLHIARLYRLLADYPSERTQAYLIYPSRRHLAPRTRVVIDFLVEQMSLVGAWMETGHVWRENKAIRQV